MKTIDEAINYAAGNLPENYFVEIRIEKHGYGVHVINPKGEILCMGEDSIIDDIILGTDKAKDQQNNRS